jgi:hypothetical protein
MIFGCILLYNPDKENDEDPKMFEDTPPAKFRLGRYALYQSIGAAIQASRER